MTNPLWVTKEMKGKRLKLQLVSTLIIFGMLLSGCTKNEDYKAAFDDFYYWDSLEIARISTSVQSSMLEDVLASIELQIEPYSEYLSLESTLDSFSIDYTMGEGFMFDIPEIIIEIIATPPEDQRDFLIGGIQQLEQGFWQTSTASVDMVAGILEGLIEPDYTRFEDLKSTTSGDTILVSYTKDGVFIEKKVIGNHVIDIETATEYKVVAESSHELMDGKLLMKHADMSVVQARGSTHTHIDVEYVDVDGVIFPSQVTFDSRFKVAGNESTASMGFNFKDIRIERK